MAHQYVFIDNGDVLNCADETRPIIPAIGTVGTDGCSSTNHSNAGVSLDETDILQMNRSSSYEKEIYLLDKFLQSKIQAFLSMYMLRRKCMTNENLSRQNICLFEIFIREDRYHFPLQCLKFLCSFVAYSLRNYHFLCSTKKKRYSVRFQGILHENWEEIYHLEVQRGTTFVDIMNDQ